MNPGDSRTFDELLAEQRDKMRPEGLPAWIEALGDSKDPRAIEVLGLYLTYSPGHLFIDYQPHRVSKELARDIRRKAGDALASFDDPAVPRVVAEKILTDEGLNAEEAWSALYRTVESSKFMSRFGSYSVDSLLSALCDERRWPEFPAVIDALAATKDPKAIEALASMLHYEWRRSEIRTGVGCFHSQTHEPGLKLSRRWADEVRCKAVDALASFDHPDVLQAVMSALLKSNFSNEVTACSALVRVKNPHKVEALLPLLRDVRLKTKVRLAVVEALSATNDPEAITPLFSLVQSRGLPGGEFVRESDFNLAMQLARLEHPDVYRAMVSALGRADSSDSAIKVLGCLGQVMAEDDPRKLEIIATLISAKDNYRASPYALEALGSIGLSMAAGDPRKIETLAAGIGSYELQGKIFEELAQIGGRDVVLPISDTFLSEKDLHDEAAACRALLSLIRKGTSIDRPSAILMRTLVMLLPKDMTTRETEKSKAAADLINKIVAVYSKALENELLARIRDLMDRGITVVEEDRSDFGVNFGSRESKYMLEFSDARRAAGAELAARAPRGTNSSQASKKPASSSRRRPADHDSWMQRLWSRLVQ